MNPYTVLEIISEKNPQKFHRTQGQHSHSTDEKKQASEILHCCKSFHKSKREWGLNSGFMVTEPAC